ncbi:MAG: O-antigen polysaccharide polymerase Wzy [Holophagaceae bacterium]
MARHLILIAAAILGLNGLVAALGTWYWRDLFFSLGLFLSLVPMVRFLVVEDGDTPFFPVLSMVYGVYYCVFGIIPFELHRTVAGVSDEAMDLASVFSCLGILSLLVGYYFVRRPKLRNPLQGEKRFSPRSASLMVLLGLISSAGWMAKFIWKVPLAFEALLTLVSEPLLFVFAGLFLLQLQKRLPRWMIAVNWFGFVPVVLATSLATSLLFPFIRLLVLGLLVYLLIRRRLPWRQVGVFGSILLILFVMKTGFRQLESATNKEKLAGTQELAKRLAVYGEVIRALGETPTAEMFQANVNIVASRLDLTHMFGFIIDHAPVQVPYQRGKTYQGLVWKFVPRLLYPEKPIERMGNDLGHDLGWLDPEDDDTSVNLPQMVELYLNFGPVGIPIGMCLIGALYGWLFNLFCKDGTKVQQVFGLFMASNLVNIESNLSIVLGGLFYLIVVMPLLLHALLHRSLEGSEAESAVSAL